MDYSKQTIAELREIAKARGLRNVSALKKKELVWPYMNRILENWHKRGLHGLEAILQADPRERNSARGKKPGEVSPGGPAAEEYRRMQRYLDKMNRGGGNGA